MFRSSFLSVPICALLIVFSSLAIAQNSVRSAKASSPVQVVYMIGSSTITTYNVDPQTLDATQVGSPLTVNATNLNYFAFPMTPSVNDHALYVFGSGSQTSQQYLWVYATDASGVPQTPSLQMIPTTGLVQVWMDPNDSFLYGVFQTSNGNYTFVNITSFQVGSGGRLSDPQSVANYKLPNGGIDFCSVQILGANAQSSELYDVVSCLDPSAYSATYNERTLDIQTGALGPDVEIYSWSSTSGGYQFVQLVGNYVYDFELPNDYQNGMNSMSIYPLVPNTTTPVVQCTATMLESCAYAQSAAVHPSGKYVFMADSQDFTEIDRVDLNAKKLVDTTNYFPAGFVIPFTGQFSPDGTIVYASGSTSIEIFGFNVQTSEVTFGGSIPVASGDTFLVTARD
jgi:hypothetical protein